MKKRKIIFPLMLLIMVITFGVLKINLINTSFYKYNKDKIDENAYKKLITELDGGVKNNLEDKSELKVYYNDKNDLVADIGKYEMLIKKGDENEKNSEFSDEKGLFEFNTEDILNNIKGIFH